MRLNSCLAALAALFAVSGPVAAQPAPEAVYYPPSAVQADFDALYAGMREAHYDLFVHTPRPVMEREHRRLRASFDAPMTRTQAQVAFQTFLALGKVAHARIDFPDEAWSAYRDAGGKAFPLRVRIVEGRTYVDADLSGEGRLVAGDELLALNGAPMEAWLGRAGRHLSADTPYLLHSLVEFYLPRLLWLELGAAERFDLRVRKRDGEAVALSLPAVTRDQWIVAEKAQPPRFELSGDVREVRLLGEGLAYLRPGPFYNAEKPEALWDPTEFRAFIDTAFGQVLDSGATDLIIDLRDNPGGDNSFSDPMVAWFADRPFRFASDFRIKVSPQATASNQARLDAEGGSENQTSRQLAALYAGKPAGSVVRYDIPIVAPRQDRRFTGRVWMLVNRRSYSNTVTVAALAQDYGFATIIGEPTSDLATTYGAMEQFTLPRTGIVVGFPKAHIIRPNGSLKAAGVTPDIPIETPVVPPATDVVLARAVEIVSKQRPR